MIAPVASPPGQLRIVLIDNYDSFTYNLVQLFAAAGQSVEVVLNDARSAFEIAAMQPDGVLLSAGPGTPDDAGVTLEVIEKLAGHVPLLGICLGHQAIAQVFGGTIVRARQLMHGKACSIEHGGTGLYKGLPPSVEMARYNSLLVADTPFPLELEITSRSGQGEVMGLRHRRWALEGVQFHPESVLSEAGDRLVGNWLSQLKTD